jgi:VanZ family protein
VIDRNWVRGVCVGAAVLMAAFLFFGAETAAKVPLFPPPFDKAAHFTYYAAMALLLVHGVGLRLALLPLLLVPLIGALDEWHQLSVPGRDASVFDWIADVAGAIAAVVAYRVWRKSGDRRVAP